MYMDDYDRSDLKNHYPEPKTYDELRKQDDERQARYEARLPKLPSLRIGLLSGVTYAALVAYMQHVFAMWVTGGIALIFFSFLIAILLLGLGTWWLKFTNATFYSFAKSSIAFVVATLILVFIGLALWILEVFASNTLLWWPLILGGGLFVLTTAIATYGLKRF